MPLLIPRTQANAGHTDELLHHRRVGVQDPYTALQTGLFLVQHVANTVRTPVPISLDRYPSPPGSTNLTRSPRQHQQQTNRQLN